MNDPSIEQCGVANPGAAVADPASRRSFLRLVGAGGAAALGTLVAACGDENEAPPPTAEGEFAPPDRDLDIINFALYLEYIEEQFYDSVNQSDAIDDGELSRIFRAFGSNEQGHARALEQLVHQLGGVPADRPRTNFRDAIDGGEQRILEVASQLENLGASAYLGQVPLIENITVREAALTIHSVEARHAAAINELAGNGFRSSEDLEGSIPHGPMAEPRSREEVLRIATDFVRV